MRQIITFLMVFFALGAIAQTQPNLPVGSKLFSGSMYEDPDGLLWSGKAGKYVCIGSKTDYNALIKAGYTKTQVDSIAVEVRKRSTHTGTQAISTVAGLQDALDGKQSSIVHNVLDYGADPTGVEDATNSITLAIYEAYVSKGVVYFPSGKYRVETSITLGDSISITGAGKRSTIFSTNEISLFNIGGSGIDIRNIRISGIDTINHVTGIELTGDRSNIIINNVTFDYLHRGLHASYTVDPYVFNNKHGVSIDQCLFEKNTIGILFGHESEYHNISNSIFQDNDIGVRMRGGNNSINGGSLSGNRVGISLLSDINNGHSVINGATINHNLEYGIIMDSITNGHIISNCLLFHNSIKIDNSNDVIFNSNQFAGQSGDRSVEVVNSQRIVLQNNDFLTYPQMDIINSKVRYFNNTFKGTQPASVEESIRSIAITDDNVSTVKIGDGVVVFRNSDSNKGMLGTDDRITAGNVNDMHLFVYGNNKFFVSTNSTKRMIVDDNGISTIGSVTSSQFKLSNLNTAPANATSVGTEGEIRITTDYIYICIATNTWVRSALTTW